MTIHPRLTPVQPAAERLPFWTRSTNPIVRRHLGLYWRTLPPEMRLPTLFLAIWSALLMLDGLLANALQFTLIFLIVSLVFLPVTWLGYAHILLTIAVNASDAMQQERRNNTLQLLRATPISLQSILLGKVASACWRRMDDWVLLTTAVALTAAPLLFMNAAPIWQLSQNPIITAVAVVGLLAVSLLRLMVEPFLVGMVGVFIGTLVPQRNWAISLSVLFSSAYFALFWLISNLPVIRGAHLVRVRGAGAFVPPNVWGILLMDYVLPIVLPLLLIMLLLKASTYLLERG